MRKCQIFHYGNDVKSHPITLNKASSNPRICKNLGPRAKYSSVTRTVNVYVRVRYQLLSVLIPPHSQHTRDAYHEITPDPPNARTHTQQHDHSCTQSAHKSVLRTNRDCTLKITRRVCASCVVFRTRPGHGCLLLMLI